MPGGFKVGSLRGSLEPTRPGRRSRLGQRRCQRSARGYSHRRDSHHDSRNGAREARSSARGGWCCSTGQTGRTRRERPELGYPALTPGLQTAWRRRFRLKRRQSQTPQAKRARILSYRNLRGWAAPPQLVFLIQIGAELLHGQRGPIAYVPSRLTAARCSPGGCQNSTAAGTITHGATCE